MLDRAYQGEALTSRSWLTADEAYGQNPGVREWLTAREIPYVLATRNDDLLTSPDGYRRPTKVLATIAGVDENGQAGANWERRSIGPGAHGERDDDWTAIALDTTGLPQGWGQWLLVRRQARPAEGKTVRELAFYRCAGPATTPLRELIRVAAATADDAPHPAVTAPIWTPHSYCSGRCATRVHVAVHRRRKAAGG